jgi:large subunit ribosomal protein L29
MPIMRLKEMRDMNSEERADKLSELRTELMRLKTMVGAGGTVENPARIRQLRKTIAQMLTVENEEKLGITEKKTEEKPKKKKKAKEKKTEKEKRKK